MRILLIAPAIPDYCVEFANALSGKARVTLIAPERFFKHLAEFVDPKVDLRLVDWPRHRSLRNPAFMWRLRREIDLLRPDLIHVLSEGVLWLNLILPTARKYGVVTTVHDVVYHVGDRSSRRVPRWFADQLIKQSNRVVVHGSALRSAAEIRYPEVKDKLSVVPHIVLDRYRAIAVAEHMQPPDDGLVRLLFFGRIYAYKGLDVLIRCMPKVTNAYPGVRAVIAGEGEDFSRYRNAMADPQVFEVRNRHIPDKEAAQLFVDADIVVLPYIEASQSGVLAIAHAFGKPVIVSDAGELGRGVVDGVTGLIVPPGDEDALADAILKLATNAAYRAQLGKEAREVAARTVSPDAVSEKAMEVYTSVIQARRG